MREENVINVSSFASDLPRPKKWEAAKKHIATLSEEELIQQAGKVLQSIHADTMFYRYFGMADYKIGLRLNDLLEELHKHIAAKQVKKRFTPMLEKHQREINLSTVAITTRCCRKGLLTRNSMQFSSGPRAVTPRLRTP